MSKRSIVLSLVVLAVLILVVHLANGQTGGYTVSLTSMDIAQPVAGEQVCPYFDRSTFGTTTMLQLSYNFEKAGLSTSDSIDLKKFMANAKVIISLSASGAPSVTRSSDKDGNPSWTISLNQAAYDANKACLEGLSVSNGPPTALAKE